MPALLGRRYNDGPARELRGHLYRPVTFADFQTNLLLRILSLAAGLLCLAITATAQISPRERQLDSLFAAEFNAGAFYGNVLIAENGKILYQRSFGLSDKTKVVSNEKSTVYELAGISKSFTAAAILLLKDKGKLGLDDLVSKHLTDFPYPGVTIRQLMQHTSGLPQYTDILSHDWQKGKCATNADLLTLLKTGKYPATAKPGERYEYNNMGYALLPLVIEKLSGKSYADFLQQNIFSPLGLSSMTVYSRRCKPRKLANYAYGYVFSERYNKYISPDDDSSSKNTVRTLDGIAGQGRVHGNIGDVYKWDRALAAGRLLSAASLKEMFTPGKLNNGKDIKDGLGWALNTNKTYGRIQNEGSSWLGYTAFIERQPDHDKTIILLQNISTNLDAIKAARRILYAQAGGQVYRKPVAVSAENLQRCAGEYEISKGYVINITVAGNGLEAKATGQRAFGLAAESDTKFYSPNVPNLAVYFMKDKGGAVSGLRMVQDGKATNAKKTK